jgi:4-amino-4-deoxy-L-arabinose transferase-like glycosyltransferase
LGAAETVHGLYHLGWGRSAPARVLDGLAQAPALLAKEGHMMLIPPLSGQAPGGPPAPFAHLGAHRLALIALFLASGLLFLGNLGGSSLWQDEAQTALVAKTVLQGGLPRGTDGINFFSQELGAEYGPEYIWRWHTWLPFYVLAAFFKLFGAGTVVARLPFALAGWLCVGALYALCVRLFQRRTVALCAAVLLALCVQHLLLSRQCRYYSFAALFSLLGLHGYLLIVLAPGRRRGLFLLIGAAALLFHTHYIYLATLLGAIFLHCAVFHRGALPQVLVAGAIPAVLNIPWVLWLASMEYPAGYAHDLTSLAHLQRNLEGFAGCDRGASVDGA